MVTPSGSVGPAVILGCRNKIRQEPRKMKVILLGLRSPFPSGLRAVRCRDVPWAAKFLSFWDAEVPV